MRRLLKLMAIAVWLGVHAWLWTLLPPLPRWEFARAATNCRAGFTPDGRSLVTSDDAAVTVWNLADGRATAVWPQPDGPAPYRDLFIPPVGRQAIISDKDGEHPAVIDLDSGRSTLLPPLGDSPRNASLMLQAYFSHSVDGRIRVQYARRRDGGGPALCVTDLATEAGRFIPLTGTGRRTVIRSSADGQTAIVVSEDDSGWSVRLVDLVRGESRELPRIARAAGAFFSVWPAGFSPDGGTAAVSVTTGPLRPKEVQLWDVASARQVATIDGVSASGWNADGRLVAAGDDFQFINAAGTVVAHGPRGSGRPNAGWPVPPGRFLFQLGSQDPPAWRAWLHDRLRLPPPERVVTVAARDACSGEEMLTVGVLSYTSLDLSADGRMLAVIDRQGTVRVWDIPPKRPGGIVLGLMIAEVGLLIAWTAWRGRIRRRRCAVC